MWTQWRYSSRVFVPLFWSGRPVCRIPLGSVCVLLWGVVCLCSSSSSSTTEGQTLQTHYQWCVATTDGRLLLSGCWTRHRLFHQTMEDTLLGVFSQPASLWIRYIKIWGQPTSYHSWSLFICLFSICFHCVISQNCLRATDRFWAGPCESPPPTRMSLCVLVGLCLCVVAGPDELIWNHGNKTFRA